ncbi:MAG: thioredoxin family protein [Muribaculaceae bacterium]|nr:thioredoxin family protein [Muribaculaceae bacterium]
MNYTEEIKSAPVVLVEFYASWCPHCQKMMPIVADIKTHLADNLKVLQFDIDKNEDLADQEKVQSIPTFILYVDGRQVMRESGEMTEEVLLQKIKAAAGDK